LTTPRTKRPNANPGRTPTLAASARAAATRHQLSRHQREQHYQRLSLIGAGVIVAIVAVLLGAGWFQSYVRPYHQTVVSVGSMRADMVFFIKELKQILPQFANSDPQVVVNAAPDSTASVIEQEFILLERAPAAGMSVTDQEVDDAVAQQLGVVGTNGAAPNRIALEAGLRDKLGSTGLTLAEFRQQARAVLLRDKLRAKLLADYPRVGPAAKYNQLTFTKPDDAKAALSRLNNGESWDSISAQVRQNKPLGDATDNDFQPKLEIEDSLAGPLFGLSNGQHTDAIQTADGRYSIALLVDKDDQHQFTDDQLNPISPRLLSDWIDEQKKSLAIKVNLTDDQKVFAVVHSDWHPAGKSGAQGAPNSAPAQPPIAVPAQAPGLETLPPGIATPAGGLVAPTIPASAATPAR